MNRLLATSSGCSRAAICAVTLFGLAISGQIGASSVRRVEAGELYAYPNVVTTRHGERVPFEEGLLFVPENRRSRESRPIAVHFIRVPHQAGTRSSAPLLRLLGGPGATMNAEELLNSWLWDLAKAAGRDLLLINQRGSSRAPATPNLRMPSCTTSSLTEAGTVEQAQLGYRVCLSEAIEAWKATGVDLSGYDIGNWVQDIDAVRRALNYRSVLIVAGSFGSQTALAYLKHFPRSVERAILSGIEPLDYAYDSPVEVWAAYQRLADLAEADPTVAKQLPAQGIIRALEEVIARLERAPVTVSIRRRDGMTLKVMIGAQDLRNLLQGPVLAGDERGAAQKWPRFVVELYGGDYRYVAAVKASQRSYGGSTQIIFFTMDNSLGVSASRDRKLLEEARLTPLGDVNWYYRATRDLHVTPVVRDEFRNDPAPAAPMLLVAGDIDQWTPQANARHLSNLLPNGKLVIAENGGTHAALSELLAMAPEFRRGVQEFLRAPSNGAAANVLRKMRSAYQVTPLEFEPTDRGLSLYEQWLEGSID